MRADPTANRLKALDRALIAGLARGAAARIPGKHTRQRSFDGWLKRIGSAAELRKLSAELARGGLFDIRCERHAVRDTDGERFTMTIARAVSTEMWPMGTHYWVRDNALIGARFLESDAAAGVRLGKALLLSALSFMSTESQLKRFDWMIRSTSKRFKADPVNWPYVFAAVKGNLNTATREGWSHKQDAWQMVAWHVLSGIERGLLSLSELTPKHRQFLAAVVPFLISIDFVTAENSGSWEEIPAIRSSVRAWEHRLIVKIAELSRQRSFAFLERGFLKARRHLPALYRRRSLQEAVSLIERRAIAAMVRDLPFESPCYPKRDLRYREGDGALAQLLMLDYPRFLAGRAGKGNAWATQLEQRILGQLLKLVDKKSGGVYRYADDSYQRSGFFRNETVQALNRLCGGPSGDASSQIAARDKIIPRGRKAAWTHFVWQLAAWAGERCIESGSQRHRKLHERFFRAGLGLVTGAKEVSCDVGPDGLARIIKLPRLRMPECYIAERTAAGREILFPSPHTPLNWAVGEMLNAFRVRERLLLLG